MTEQSPAQEAGPAPVTPEIAEVVEGPASPIAGSVAAHLMAVRDTLLWSVREDGSHLWEARWLGETCLPRLSRLLPQVDEGVAKLLGQACDHLATLVDLAWFERTEPIRTVIGLVNDALDRLEPVRPEFRPKALLVSGAEGASVEGEEEEEPRRGRRDSRRKKGSRAARTLEVPPRKRPSSPHLPPAPFGAPNASGRPLTALVGVDAGLVKALAEVGIETIAQLLRQLPVDVEALSLADLEEEMPEDGATVAIRGKVVVRWRTLLPAGGKAQLHLRWGEHVLRCSWPERWPHGAAYTLPDDELVVAGTLRHVGDDLVLENALPWKPGKDDRVWRPRYGLAGIEDQDLWCLLHEVAGVSLPRLIDPVPRDLLASVRMPRMGEAYRDLHQPLGPKGRGRSRLVFDEFFTYRLTQSATKVVRPKGIAHSVCHDLLSQLCVQHGIQLDDQQERAFDDVRRDLGKRVAMVRLLQGDVSSGKALVALMAAVMVAEGRSQVLFLAPDSLAAEHRYMFAEPLLRSVGLVPHLLGREPNKAQLDALRRGEAHIVFASRALMDRPDGLPEFKKLGLVVAEERQSFGTVTLADLGQGKFHPDLLVVTSVPIPSSLVFTLFSSYDLTVLPPSSSSRVSTEVVPPDRRQRGFEVIQETLAQGHQAYIVFPLSQGADVVDRARGTSLAQALANEALDGARVALYHGSMSREERLRIFEDFRSRRIDVLLATTTIEDAPEVTNATAMIVENADRFDLVRLHRLRGHVSLGHQEGRCVLVVSQEPDQAGQRIVDLVASEEDGFAIAEQDRLERGDGELLGGRVSELPVFEIGDPVQDRDLFVRARKAAIQLLVKDPELRQRAHRALARQIHGLPEPEEGDHGGDEGESGTRKRRRRRRRSGRR